MNIKQAVRETQDNWLKRSLGKPSMFPCGFCAYRDGCAGCPVKEVFGVTCSYLPSYRAWEKSFMANRYGEGKPELAREVLKDVNKIAAHYHLKQVWDMGDQWVTTKRKRTARISA